jgi:hypothetical protein
MQSLARNVVVLACLWELGEALGEKGVCPEAVRKDATVATLAATAYRLYLGGWGRWAAMVTRDRHDSVLHTYDGPPNDSVLHTYDGPPQSLGAAYNGSPNDSVLHTYDGPPQSLGAAYIRWLTQ